MTSLNNYFHFNIHYYSINFVACAQLLKFRNANMYFTLQLHCLGFDYLPVSDGLFPTDVHLRIYLTSGIFVRLNLIFCHSRGGLADHHFRGITNILW